MTRTIQGKFRVVAMLPRGPLGQAYHVEDVFLQLPRRLKTPHEQGAYAVRLQHYFYRLQALAPRLGAYVQVPLHMFVAENRFYVVDPWRPHLAPPRLVSRLALLWVWHFGWALMHMHDAGFVHGGLSLTNVGQDEQGQLYLLDAGWRTVALASQASSVRSLTQDPSWPPEARQGQELTPKADVYGLAFLLYHWLVGQPYTGAWPAHPLLQPWEEVLQQGLVAEPAQRPAMPAWLQMLAQAAARVHLRLTAPSPSLTPGASRGARPPTGSSPRAPRPQGDAPAPASAPSPEPEVHPVDEAPAPAEAALAAPEVSSADRAPVAASALPSEPEAHPADEAPAPAEAAPATPEVSSADRAPVAASVLPSEPEAHPADEAPAPAEAAPATP
ncbi:MAG: hypothetical protein GXO54_06500, partial [Chloroflexi bacterium]|nr:hypothetical protein [Chloroflexota bacterium]